MGLYRDLLAVGLLTGENILVNIRHSRFVMVVYNVLEFGAKFEFFVHSKRFDVVEL